MAAITPVLQRLNLSQHHGFQEPVRQIHEGPDVTYFLSSKAYADIMTFLLQLNAALFPRKSAEGAITCWPLGSEQVEFSNEVLNLASLLQKCANMIDEAPPDPGPRRFGNVAFRKWYGILESRISDLLKHHLPRGIVELNEEVDGKIGPLEELRHYLLGSFGSVQRLDYGTGHELSFLAFLGGMWKLSGFQERPLALEERGIVLGVVHPYLQLVRRLIKTYNLEPAGSHGVWGLDDHSFVPYIFGSAQISHPITKDDEIPQEGSLPDAPDPGDVAKINVVERERDVNLYFGAVGFINDVKKGPFWEHSPMLYDISGVRAGWAKINKGMIKMYIAEVLSKFPVVQHFPFGRLFQWDRDPNAQPSAQSTHVTNQPTRAVQDKPTRHHVRPTSNQSQAPTTGTTAPQGLGVTSTMPSTRAPWAKQDDTDTSGSSLSMPLPTRAPWAKDK